MVRFALKTNIFSLAFSANNTHLYWYVGLDSPQPYPLAAETTYFQWHHGKEAVQV